ncbi:hypothetical protein ZIOFF_036859 [Zingiber officinale]|uniref:Uncharacterized protein n=1 Tax=Zingiber officinale TaxID=94328 RepID=A0A8J5GAM6_ZINOF|nr:hypothetical protein ZIOFF_036859 [Zingiber officinale]
MKLRPEFEVTRIGLLNRNPVPSLDICLGELLPEEQRMATQAVLGLSKEISGIVNVAYAAKGRTKNRDKCSAIVAKSLGILPVIVVRSSAIIVNKMDTLSSNVLHNLQKYTDKQNIQIANDSNLPITTIGDIGPSFRHVFVSPGLSTSLISVGQLVDNNCDVNFSRCGCLVQDQRSRKLDNANAISLAFHLSQLLDGIAY